MRRNYISPEYNSVRVYGTFNMVEESNFFSSKMLDIEDTITIGTQDLIYYQNLNNEQLDFSIESSLQSYIYSSFDDKSKNHTLVLDETQPIYQKDKNTRWILTIDVESILKNYLFSVLKKYRSFEGLKKGMTIYDDVNVAISKYIDFNVYDRYKIGSIDLYISYKFLREQKLLRYKNVWSKNIISSENKFTKIQSEISLDKSTVKLTFNQDKPSEDYVFEYYFNINFEKL